ncbi:MAG: peptidase S41, partial [Spirochaetaceae bacterium]|nr:peptidase S41 [Spirochaetaceae bacterium]
MNFPLLPENGRESRKINFRLPVLWISLTVAFSLILIAIAAPKVSAQNSADQNSARYTSMIQNVFDFIQKHYVEEVDPQKLYEGAMNGMFNALGDPYSTFLAEKDM